MEKYEQLKSLVSGMQSDIEKFFEKGNAAAGTRLRQSLQEIKVAAQDLRIEIQDIKKNEKNP